MMYNNGILVQRGQVLSVMVETNNERNDNKMKTKSNEQNCRVYTPEDVANILGIGMTSTYALLKKQMTMRDFGVKRIGKVYRVECKSFDRWIGDQDAC